MIPRGDVIGTLAGILSPCLVIQTCMPPSCDMTSASSSGSHAPATTMLTTWLPSASWNHLGDTAESHRELLARSKQFMGPHTLSILTRID
jgi:hypothetical protein